MNLNPPTIDVENQINTESLNPAELRKYFDILYHWKWLILIITLVGGLSAFLYSYFFVTPIYQSTTTLLISEATASRTTDYNAILTSERLARTYSEMLIQRPVLEETIAKLSLTQAPEYLKKSIDVQLLRDTQLIRVSVDNSNPYKAAEIANTLVNTFIQQNAAMQADRFTASKESLANQLAILDEQINKVNDQITALRNNSEDTVERDRLQTTLNQYRQTYASLLQSYEQTRITEAQSTSSIVQVEEAIPDLLPIRPKTTQNTILASLLSCILSIVVVFLIEMLDTTVKTSQDLHPFGIPIIGYIGKTDIGQMPITVEQPRSPISEAFRSIRTNLRFSSIDSPTRSLIVTSPIPGEGKTTVAVNLGVVLAQSGLRVILIDADLHRPAVHRRFKMNNNFGLTTLFMQSEPDLQAVLKQTPVNGLSIMTSGPLPPNPSELLGSEKMGSILQAVMKAADYVIIDTPPVTVVTDAAVLSKRVDGMVMVVCPGKTPVYGMRQALNDIARIGGKVLGVVLNDLHSKGVRYGYHQGYYYYKRKYYYYGASGNGNQSRKKKEESQAMKKTQPVVEEYVNNYIGDNQVVTKDSSKN